MSHTVLDADSRYRRLPSVVYGGQKLLQEAATDEAEGTN
jgi:hypothetical protein